MGGILGTLGSVFRTQKLALGTVAYVSGGAGIPLDVPRGLLLKKLQLRISGTFTIAGGPITSWNSEAPLGLLSRIELTADGRKPFCSISGRNLYRKNHKDNNFPGELVNTALLVNGSYPFSAYMEVDLGAARTINPFVSWLDTRLYDGLQLKLTFAAPTALVVAGGATVSITGCVVDVIAEYTTVGFDLVQYNKIVVQDSLPIVAAMQNLKLTVPRNGLLADVMYAANVDAVVNDALISTISLRSENSVMHIDHATWATMQSSNAVQYQLLSATPGARIPGYVFHDLTEDFQLESALDTAALNVLDNLFDTTLPAGTTRLLEPVYTFFEPVGR